jgi:signal transduction histidine kinase
VISRRSARGVVGRLPLSVRLGATFAAVFLVVVALLVVLAYWGVGRMLRQDLDRALVDVLAEVDDTGSAMTTSDDRELGGVKSSEIETQLLDRAGEIVGASDDDLLRVPLLDGAQLDRVLDRGVLFADASDGEDPYRILARPLPGDSGDVQVFAVDGDTVVDAQAALVRLAGPLAACAALLAGLTGWLVARRGLTPLTELTAQADALNAADPSRRLELRSSENEVARLGRTLNGLLDRIDDARRRERQFTADASHELRTPLAILRAEVELLRDRTAEDSTLRAPLDSALEECDRLTNLVADLLEVARADAGQMDRGRLVDVAAIVDALLPRFSVLASRRGVRLTSEGDAAVHADPRALGRALSNLLDNAVRHASEGGQVQLEIVQRIPYVAVTVTDDGPGVDPADRRRATERFSQLEPARGNGGGAGLGLAMVASIAAAHGGSLELATPPAGRGLAVTLRLPVDAAGGSSA